MTDPRSVHASVSLPRRLAAVWFADIVGYTRLAVEDENAALAVVGRFQQLVAEVLAAHQGRLVKLMGDAALAEFPSARSAVSAALALIEGLAAAGHDPGRAPIVARAGIHIGEVATTPEGDLLGEDVNLASRIHTAAEPGQVVVSEDVVRQLRNLREIMFEPLGERELKGVPDLTRVYVARAAERAAGPRGAPAAPRSIAVLPFANISPDPANEYFSDGVMEEILTLLAGIEGLKVISRTSAMRYRGTSRSLRQIGEELGVASLLEGSVRRSGHRVRITAQLIDARTDEHLWAERYDRDLEDIFAVQTDVAERIVEALKVRLTEGQRARLAERPTRNMAAYQHYLQGIHFWNRRERGSQARAAREYEAAIALDPAFVHAWAGLAGVHATSTDWDPVKADKSLRVATEAAERALALDPRHGFSYAMLAQVRMREWRWEETDRLFARAVELNSGDPTIRQWYAHYLASMGRFDEAFEHTEIALELDPLSLPVQAQAALVMVLARRFDEAERRLLHARDLNPDFLPAAGMWANLLHHTGRHGEALAIWRRVKVVPDDGATAPDAHLDLRLASIEQVGGPPGYAGIMCAVVGRKELALEHLEKALAAHDITVSTFARMPFLDSLRDDPRFQAILTRCGLA